MNQRSSAGAAGVIALTGTLVILSALPASGETTFGKTSKGETVQAFTLKNANGMQAKLITRGATLTHLLVPGKDGQLADVVLGFDDVQGYESDANQYFGCTTGRVANRIAKGQFTVDGKSYQVAVNNGPNHLHGGTKRSLDKVIWEAEPIKGKHGDAVRFHYLSPDGEEGFPGNLDITVTYTLTDNNELRIDYLATTDKPTPINLTNHSYFNLSGAGSPSILDHLLTIHAAKYTPTDEHLIPTGKIDSVEGTPLDFRTEQSVGKRIAEVIATPALGYDHNYVIDRQGDGLVTAAVVRDPQSGRVMTVKTTEPGVQLYTGNHLFGQKGKEGKAYPQRSALCLETQHFPDSVNHDNFPSTILKPGERYTQTTIYAFSVEQ